MIGYPLVGRHHLAPRRRLGLVALLALLSVWPACSTTRTSNAPTSAHRLTGTIREFPLPSPDQPASEVSAIPGGRVYMSAGPVSVQGITAGPDGDIWFTEDDENTGKVGRITSTGKITEFVLPTTNVEPGTITAGPDGALWFTEGTAGKIGRITKAGQIREFALPGFTVGHEVDYITAGPDGTLWFTDLAGVNSKIGQITLAGTVKEFALPPISQPSRGRILSGITAGPDAVLWFTETIQQQQTFTSKVGRITPTGKVMEFSLPPVSQRSVGSGTLGGITAGPGGALWFIDYEGANATIDRITPAGTVTKFALLKGSAPAGITVGADGALWFTETVQQGQTLAGKIGRITPSGTITEYPLPTPHAGPISITTAPDGTLWFTEFASGRIGHLD